MKPKSALVVVAGAWAIWLAGAPALAQFASPTPTPVRERIRGEFLSAEGEPAPEAGDQLGAFAGDTIVGLHLFTGSGDAARAFDLLIFGDNPNTTPVEGPERGDRITFRFYDSSTNTIRTDVQALSQPPGRVEVVNVSYMGELVIDIPGVPIDLTPTRGFDMRFGTGGGGGGGGGNGGDEPDLDVNGDGEITKDDAALVLRIVIGAGRAVPAEAVRRADVNGDGVVDTNDAVEILRAL